MLECKNINQVYKTTQALSDVSFTLDKGVYGLVGEGLMLNHWIGKGILLFIVTVLNGGRILFNTFYNRKV